MMRLQLISLLSLSLFLCACEKQDDRETYRDLQIADFSYAEIPATGGTVCPQLSYSYKVTLPSGKEEQRTTGAATMFTGDNSNFAVDKESGKITAPANMSVEPISFTIDLVVSKESLSAYKTITVIQAGAKEEIIDTKTVQLPIVLAPHTCVYPAGYDPENKTYLFDTTKEYEYTTTRTDGKTDRDYMDQINPKSGIVGVGAKIGVTSEYVSAAGVEIPVSGGDIVNINTYRSGKVDTAVVSKAVYSVSTNYTFRDEWYVEDNTSKYTVDEESERPKSTISNGVWKINKIGYGIYSVISHTLSATANGNTVSIIINQQNNYVIGKKQGRLKFNNHELFSQRDDWPNFEDYPVGSNPKWVKDQYGDWHNTHDTKNLHPDGNRYIDFYLCADYDRMGGGNIYISGAEGNDYRIQRHNGMRELRYHQTELYYYSYNSFLRGGVIITAIADVKLKDGTSKTITHTSEWIQPEEPVLYDTYNPSTGEHGQREEWDEYKGRRGMPSFTIYLPVVENVAEDFTWKIKINFTLNENSQIAGYNLKKQSNFFEYNWVLAEFQFADCLYTVDQFHTDRKFSGIFNTSRYNKDNQGDIIDGVEQ